MVDEFGMMEVLVDGVPRRRQAIINCATDGLFGRVDHGLRIPEPELRANEASMASICGKTYIFKVKA